MTLIKFTLVSAIKFVFLFFFLSRAETAFAQVLGCTDPTANNFNSLANTNDGSCTYNTTTYTPAVKVDPVDAMLNENSGLQMAGNFLWSFNDGGGAAAIYRIDTITNTILQTVNLVGATNVDWEDIAFDGSYFYVGDFGNNANGARTDLKIYKFPLSSIPAYDTDPVFNLPSSQIEVLNFTYSDQPQPTVATTANNTAFDCEAMIIDGGKVHLFTKNWIGNSTTHYVLNSLNAGTYVALPLETLTSNYLVTGADKSAGQGIVALLGYQVTGTGNHFLYLFSDYSNGNYFNGNKRKINLPDATVMGQCEGITFKNESYGYISNEKFVRSVGPIILSVTPKLRSFDISNYIPVYVLPIELKKFEVRKENGIHTISWEFDSSKSNVEIQQSNDAIHFTNLKTFLASTADFFSYKPSAHLNYYRLAWKNNDGILSYSNILNVKDDDKNSFKNFMLRQNGELSFIINSNPQGTFTFKLINADGRYLSEIKSVNCVQGLNKIHFYHKPISNNFVLLSVYNTNEKMSRWLHVEN